MLAALILLLPVNAAALGAEIEIPGGALFQDDLKMVTDFTVDMNSCASLIGVKIGPNQRGTGFHIYGKIGYHF